MDGLLITQHAYHLMHCYPLQMPQDYRKGQKKIHFLVLLGLGVGNAITGEVCHMPNWSPDSIKQDEIGSVFSLACKGSFGCA